MRHMVQLGGCAASLFGRVAGILGLVVLSGCGGWSNQPVTDGNAEVGGETANTTDLSADMELISGSSNAAGATGTTDSAGTTGGSGIVQNPSTGAVGGETIEPGDSDGSGSAGSGSSGGSGAGVSEDPTASEAWGATVKPAGLTTGVGLCPRSYDADGVVDAFEKTAAIAGLGVVQMTFAWDRLHGRTAYPTYTAYEWLIAPDARDGKNLFQRSGLKKGFWLSFLEPADPTRLRLTDYAGTPGFRNPELAVAFIGECVWFADYFHPDYLAIGTEIDSYIRVSSTEERGALLQTITTAHDAIKAAHPEMVVFVYFQYENVKSGALWALIQPFANASDVFAFSSYPSMPIDGPNTGMTAARLPADYYAAIRENLGSSRPVVFAELGHPAAASSLFASGSELEQARFIQKWFTILPSDTSLAVWIHLYDPDLSSVYAPDVAAYFGSTGLLRRP